MSSCLEAPSLNKVAKPNKLKKLKDSALCVENSILSPMMKYFLLIVNIDLCSGGQGEGENK